jgi:hypothetical protein
LEASKVDEKAEKAMPKTRAALKHEKGVKTIVF